jgi:SAM-dependent methyltransferase
MPEMTLMARSEITHRRAPHATYKLELERRIRAMAPGSLLDVGCGNGELLRAAADAGSATCIGLEVDDALVAARRDDGLDVRLGRAEALPFADRSIDVVALEYVAHHVEHLERALLEAARVARRAVIVLDPWYDVSFASQRVARDFDLWLKIIDRRTGMVHEPCADASRLAAPFLALGGFEIEASHHLVLQAMAVADVERTARARLASVPGSPELEAQLAAVLDAARLHGISHDGALCLAAIRM